jgi:hypothetical protein
MVEPDQEGNKKSDPGHMQDFCLAGKRQQIQLCTTFTHHQRLKLIYEALSAITTPFYKSFI